MSLELAINENTGSYAYVWRSASDTLQGRPFKQKLRAQRYDWLLYRFMATVLRLTSYRQMTCGEHCLLESTCCEPSNRWRVKDQPDVTCYFISLLMCSNLDVELLARSQYSEDPATDHLDTGFSWFPCVYKQTLRRFPTFQVATTCFSCSPPDLNLLVTNFIFCIHVK